METAESLILSGTCPPLVLKNQISNWSASKWTPQYLANELSDKKYRCKVAPKADTALWETECIHEEITLQQFVDWNDGKPREDNPLKIYSRSDFSCYIDYKYMKDLFDIKSDHLKEVDWGTFGLEGRDGSESTIWIGSDGCYTNCHYDTYGFNLVAQIYGRKRWILFPPSDSSNMYPTRIPYEESSVFSQVNVKHPDLDIHAGFQLCHPHVVELSPGDVLYVPKHWWHYVECLDTSISINTWVEMDEDTDSQVNEAVTRLLFKCLIDMNLEDNKDWINPGEEIQDHAVNFVYLQNALRQLNENINKTDTPPSPCSNISKFATCVGKLLQREEIEQKIFKGKVYDQMEQNLHGNSGKNGKRKNITTSRKNIKKQKKIDKSIDSEVSTSCEENSNQRQDTTECKETGQVTMVHPISIDTYQREIILHKKDIAKVDDADYSLDFEDIEISTNCESCVNTKHDVAGGTHEQLLHKISKEFSDADIVSPVVQHSVNTAVQSGLTFKCFAQSLLHPEVIGKIKDILKSQP